MKSESRLQSSLLWDHFCRNVTICVLPVIWLFVGAPAMAQPDLYIKDTPADTGMEPNPDTGPMWVTEDIWVRRTPDPNYQPLPFLEASPSWFPLAHQNPEYRDPIFSVPNYVYVRVRNRGTTASTGTERLKLYWAKASTGLAWDTQWTDYLDSTCGPTRLYGAEITKPRKNAATASISERDAYRDAILAAGTTPTLAFPDGVSYWHKQNGAHRFGPANRHGTAAFLPWHREFINRYEVLLQKANPLVRLLYWDWTTDPENSTGGFNFFTNDFMGASGRGTGGTSIGLPFIPALLPPAVTRNLSTSISTPADPDSTLLASPFYPNFRSSNEEPPNHDSAHGYVGGGGNLSSITRSAEDPFFFLLHANADRLWAQWQRDPVSLSRLEPGTAYDGDTTNTNITSPMGPWDGTASIPPWTTATLGGQIYHKTPQHASVVTPPIYDTAPLSIPALLPGEAVVIQALWYPPDPAEFSCFGLDQSHFCLLARIETSDSPPFGMTFPEVADIGANTKSNNNIAWKNINVVDNFSGSAGIVSTFVRNVFDEAVVTGIRFVDSEDFGPSFFDAGRIIVDLGPELYTRWILGGSVGKDIQPIDDTSNTIEILSAAASVRNILFQPEEAFPVSVRFELFDDYEPLPGVLPKWDIIQIGAPGDPEAILGGNRYEIDFRKLELVPAGSEWRYLDTGQDPGPSWRLPDFDDSGWRLGRARIGFGTDSDTTIAGGPVGDRHISTYFRHSFQIEDPEFLQTLTLRLNRDDGSVVYLNGTEIHRINMPTGPPSSDTLATREVQGLEERVFFTVLVTPGLDFLNEGKNVVAVEVHQVSSDSDDLSFDLELSANALTDRFAPYLEFSSPAAGSLLQAGEIIPVTIEALDTDADGQITLVSFLVDGEKISETDQGPPFSFQWTAASTGRHRFRAVAKDSDQEQATADLLVSVVLNTPPSANLIEPHDREVFQVGETIQVLAEASDPAGAVLSVEFYLRSMATWFTDPPQNVGLVFAPPYSVELTLSAAGHYMLYAVAIDNEGVASQSNPAHFEIRADSHIFADGFESGDLFGWGSSNP